MTPTVGFITFLLVTVALLGCVLVTGFQGKRKPHLILVALAVASLGTTIYFAEQLGRLYDLDAAGWITPVHLTLAKVTTFAYVAPIFTGFRLLKDPTWRPRHKRMAFLVLGLTLLTAATGTWMILASEPLPVGE